MRPVAPASRTYVVCSAKGNDVGAVVVYYSLAAGAIAHDDARAWAKRNMPNPIAEFVLGRLAVDSGHQGKGLGSALLKEAIQRSLAASRTIGARALIVHAIDDGRSFGFQRFPTDGRTCSFPSRYLTASKFKLRHHRWQRRGRWRTDKWSEERRPRFSEAAFRIIDASRRILD